MGETGPPERRNQSSTTLRSYVICREREREDILREVRERRSQRGQREEERSAERGRWGVANVEESYTDRDTGVDAPI